MSGPFLPCSSGLPGFPPTVVTFIPTLLHPHLLGGVTFFCDFPPKESSAAFIRCPLNCRPGRVLWQPAEIQTLDFPDQLAARRVNHNQRSSAPQTAIVRRVFFSVVYPKYNAILAVLVGPLCFDLACCRHATSVCFLLRQRRVSQARVGVLSPGRDPLVEGAPEDGRENKTKAAAWRGPEQESCNKNSKTHPV